MSGTVQVLGCSQWNRTLLLLSPDVLPECHVPAGLGVWGLQWHSWVSDFLVGLPSAVSMVSAESQTHKIILEKASKIIESFSQLEKKGEIVAVWRLKKNPTTHLSGLEVGLGSSKEVPAALPIHVGNVSSSQTHIHDLSLCFASWQLQRGRHKVGGRGERKTNCSHTWGPWALQVFQTEKKVIFNSKLVTGFLMSAFSS